MQDKQKSGQRIKNRIRKPSSLDDQFENDSRLRSSPKDPRKSEDEIQMMANCTYDRVLKNKSHKQPFDSQLFCDYIQNKTDIDRLSMLSQSTINLIDVRDKRVKIPFQSKIYRQYEQRKSKFNCELFLEEIRDWLVDVIQIVTSIAFNHLKNDELNLSEVKNYTAKNILGNVKDLFERYSNLSLQNRVQLMKFVNIESLKIFDHIMNKYPQNSGNRASKRVKSRIPKIDNRQSDEFDFLKCNGINIKYRDNGDYSEDIMKVINKLISFSTEPFDVRDENQESNFQVFTQIMEYVFENSTSQPILTTIENVSAIINEKTGLTENLNALKHMIGMTFHIGDEMASKQEYRTQRKEQNSNIRQNPKNYAICHKIPAGTRQFSEEEIEGCQFRSNDASILRILTKWVEQLYNKLCNAEEAIYTRLYKFKDNRGKLVNLNIDLRQELYQAAREELKTVKEYIKYLRKQNGYLQTLFAGQTNLGKYSKLDTKIGIFATKINEIGSQYIFKHLNKLIHRLLSIPRTASAQRNNQAEKLLLQSINLVTLKIGDLLRCKHSCSQHEFLRTIEILEEIHLKNPEILKIVRIKNRLDKNHNDILINLFFMGKVECELQLSLRGKVKDTQQKYGDFCHLIYEITRARLGPISEMSSIIINHDPLARLYAKQKTLGPELKEEHLTQKQKKMLFSRIKQEITLKTKQNIGNTIQLPFICRSCRSLAILSNPQFLYRNRKDVEIDCNQCRFQDLQLDRPLEAYEYIVNETFKKTDEDTRRFIMNHLTFWSSDKFISSLHTNTISSHKSFEIIPSYGLLMTTNQKKPKLYLFSTAIEPAEGSFIFAHVNDDGKQKIITKLTMKHEKTKQIQQLKEQFKKLIIFQFNGTFQKNQDGILKLECIKSNCCNREYTIGPILDPQNIVQISEKTYISNLIEHQKSVLRMNLIKEAFRKLEEVLINLKNRGTLTPKFLRAVENIKAYKCQIVHIEIVENFPNLIEINISDNREIKSLKGLQTCKYVRNIEARNCDIRNLDDIRNNIRIMYVNASRNFNLVCIRGLEDHCHLVELIISHTSVSDLSPLNSCPSLEILDIENCSEVQSINAINAAKLSFLNTYGCLKLPQDPNQSLINSLMRKSHFPLKRSTSQMEQMTNSNIYGLPQNMTRSFEFDPLSTGLEFAYKCFTTLMYDDLDPPTRKSIVYYDSQQEERTDPPERRLSFGQTPRYLDEKPQGQNGNAMAAIFKLFG